VIVKVLFYILTIQVRVGLMNNDMLHSAVMDIVLLWITTIRYGVPHQSTISAFDFKQIRTCDISLFVADIMSIKPRVLDVKTKLTVKGHIDNFMGLLISQIDININSFNFFFT
jgi:hypothetical protein